MIDETQARSPEVHRSTRIVREGRRFVPQWFADTVVVGLLIVIHGGVAAVLLAVLFPQSV